MPLQQIASNSMLPFLQTAQNRSGAGVNEQLFDSR